MFSTETVWRCEVRSHVVDNLANWDFLSSRGLSYLLAYLLTHSLIPRYRTLFEKLIDLSLSKISFLYGTRRFITVFTKARHWTLFWASRIQFATSIPISVTSRGLAWRIVLSIWMATSISRRHVPYHGVSCLVRFRLPIRNTNSSSRLYETNWRGILWLLHCSLFIL
jgi:hypothetical protein